MKIISFHANEVTAREVLILASREERHGILLEVSQYGAIFYTMHKITTVLNINRSFTGA